MIGMALRYPTVFGELVIASYSSHWTLLLQEFCQDISIHQTRLACPAHSARVLAVSKVSQNIVGSRFD